jgi:TPR repeat protein
MEPRRYERYTPKEEIMVSLRLPPEQQNWTFTGHMVDLGQSGLSLFNFLLFVAVLVGFAALAYAGLDDAVSAYEKGDYARAYGEFKALAEQGNAGAQCRLGTQYAKGQGVPKDYVQALKWYRRAAEQGHAEAQYYLGVMFDTGEGVPQDYGEAIKWYRKAAEQGLAVAQSNLGAMYGLGQGVPQDYVQALKWFNLAASQGYPEAQKGMDLIGNGMTPAQIAEAKRLAKEWKPKSRD